MSCSFTRWLCSLPASVLYLCTHVHFLFLFGKKQIKHNFIDLLVDFIVVPCTVRASAAGGIKLVGVPHPKQLHEFSPNFEGMFTPRGSRAD